MNNLNPSIKSKWTESFININYKRIQYIFYETYCLRIIKMCENRRCKRYWVDIDKYIRPLLLEDTPDFWSFDAVHLGRSCVTFGRRCFNKISITFVTIWERDRNGCCWLGWDSARHGWTKGMKNAISVIYNLVTREKETLWPCNIA